MSVLRVMLVDDHALVRLGFKLLLQGEEGISVVAEAATGEEALQRYADTRPDVVVMDISMPGIGGMEALTRLLAKDPAAKVLILSAHEDSSHPHRLLKAGAVGYLSKRSAPEELIQALHHVAAGKTFLDSRLAHEMAVQKFSGAEDPVKALSDREFEVFMLLAKGLTVAKIAEQLSLSPRTVGTHLYNIKQKLNAENSAEITLTALRSGLLEH
jgi:two-component system invasion response regulator UvrY